MVYPLRRSILELLLRDIPHRSPPFYRVALSTANCWAISNSHTREAAVIGRIRTLPYPTPRYGYYSEQAIRESVVLTTSRVNVLVLFGVWGCGGGFTASRQAPALDGKFAPPSTPWTRGMGGLRRGLAPAFPWTGSTTSVPVSPYRFFGFQAAYLIGTPNTPNEAGLSDVVPVGIAF